MKKLFQAKSVIWLVALGGFGCVLASLFIQFVLGKQPCNLCILQRILVFIVGCVALFLAILVTVVFKKTGKKGMLLCNFVLSIPALAGAAVAIQHIYIQSLPLGSVQACGSPIEFMMRTMPITEVIQKVLAGSGECQTVETFLWLPIPIWSLLFFGGSFIFIWSSWFFVGRKNLLK